MAKHEIKTMSHHSQHHFITQYIFFCRYITVNEFHRMIRMGVAGGHSNHKGQLTCGQFDTVAFCVNV